MVRHNQRRMGATVAPSFMMQLLCLRNGNPCRHKYISHFLLFSRDVMHLNAFSESLYASYGSY